MSVNVSDDEVLQGMSQFGIDAEDLDTFRYFRNLMEQGVPLCCVAFMHFYVVHSRHMSTDRMDAILDDASSRGIKLSAAAAQWSALEYWMAARDSAGRDLNYTPCPACVLAKRFVDVVPGCACCADGEEYPDP